MDSSKQKRNIEVQLRTRIQHYWATAIEIVDLFTDQALKSNQGDEVWKTFFLFVSEQFAIMDNYVFSFILLRVYSGRPRRSRLILINNTPPSYRMFIDC